MLLNMNLNPVLFNLSVSNCIIFNNKTCCLGKSNLIKNFGSGYPFPKFKAPKILFWLIAPLFGVNRNFVNRNVGFPLYFDNSKSKKELGMDYIPISKTIVDFFQQFVDEKIV